jgi:hypothetical protein
VSDWSIHPWIERASMAPEMRALSSPRRNRIIVGIDRMPQRPARPGAASVLTLAKRTRPFICAAARSKAGAIAWHGAHHSAQKSTTTGNSVRATAGPKLESVRHAVERAAIRTADEHQSMRAPEAFTTRAILA